MAVTCALAPVTAAHAEALRPGSGGQASAEATGTTGAAAPGLSLTRIVGNLVGDLITEIEELDDAGAIEDAAGQPNAQSGAQSNTQSVAIQGSAARVGLSEAWSAPVAERRENGELVSDGSSCSWMLRTQLEAGYDPGTRNLAHVSGRPVASLSCRGAVGLPARQDLTLQQTVNGATPQTLTSEHCRNDTGCRRVDLAGSYDCSGGERCAGPHRLTLRHAWTLPSPYEWASAPDQCEITDRGATLRCVTSGKTVTIPANRGGIRIGDAAA